MLPDFLLLYSYLFWYHSPSYCQICILASCCLDPNKTNSVFLSAIFSLLMSIQVLMFLATFSRSSIAFLFFTVILPSCSKGILHLSCHLQISVEVCPKVWPLGECWHMLGMPLLCTATLGNHCYGVHVPRGMLILHWPYSVLVLDACQTMRGICPPFQISSGEH